MSVGFSSITAVDETVLENLLSNKEIYAVPMTTGFGPMDVRVVFDFMENVGVSREAAMSA